MSGLLDREEFKQYKSAFEDRHKTLMKRAAYYDGSVYLAATSFENLGWMRPRFYKAVRPLYLPLARAVDVDCGIIPGGWPLDEEGIAQGTIDAWDAAAKRVFEWSDWETEGVLFVQYGATYGVTGLKIADLRDDSKVIIQPVNPCCYLLVPSGAYDPTPAMSIWIEKRLDEKGEEFEYGEVIDPTQVKTFKNGEPFGFDGRETEYPNALGFVPFVEARHMETGGAYGEATYQKVVPMLDEVNRLATYLADVIQKNTDPQWAVSGAEPGELDRGSGSMWFLPVDAKVSIMVPNVDIQGVLEFVKEIALNVKDGLPELAFDELKSKTHIATATLELQLMELVLKIQRCRPNYDHALADALRMAGRAAGTMGGLDGVSGLDDLALKIDASRPVLPVDRMTEIEIEMAELNLEQAKSAAGIQEGADASGDGADSEDATDGDGQKAVFGVDLPPSVSAAPGAANVSAGK